MYKSVKSSTSWQKIINAYEQSNLVKADFCKKNKLSANQFYYWCNKLRPDLKSEISASQPKVDKFLPVKTPQREKSLSITLSNGMRINFDSLPDPAWIANLITSVGDLHAQP